MSALLITDEKGEGDWKYSKAIMRAQDAGELLQTPLNACVVVQFYPWFNF